MMSSRLMAKPIACRTSGLASGPLRPLNCRYMKGPFCVSSLSFGSASIRPMDCHGT